VTEASLLINKLTMPITITLLYKKHLFSTLSMSWNADDDDPAAAGPRSAFSATQLGLIAELQAAIDGTPLQRRLSVRRRHDETPVPRHDLLEVRYPVYLPRVLSTRDMLAQWNRDIAPLPKQTITMRFKDQEQSKILSLSTLKAPCLIKFAGKCPVLMTRSNGKDKLILVFEYADGEQIWRFLDIDRSLLQACTRAEMQADVPPTTEYCWLDLLPTPGQCPDWRYVRIDHRIVLGLPSPGLEFLFVGFTNLGNVLVAVQISAEVKEALGKEKQWALVFPLPKTQITMSKEVRSVSNVTWKFIDFSECKRMGLDIYALPGNCDFIPQHSIGSTDMWDFLSAEAALYAAGTREITSPETTPPETTPPPPESPPPPPETTRTENKSTQTEAHEVSQLQLNSMRLLQSKTKLHEHLKKMYLQQSTQKLETEAKEAAHSAEVDFFASSHALAIATLAVSQEIVYNQAIADQCSMCFEPRTHAFGPCGHFCVCADCYPDILGSVSALCPVCREPVQDARRIFA
jgi:hypothetical protein